jgi:hypothetical protein
MINMYYGHVLYFFANNIEKSHASKLQVIIILFSKLSKLTK